MLIFKNNLFNSFSFYFQLSHSFTKQKQKKKKSFEKTRVLCWSASAWKSLTFLRVWLALKAPSGGLQGKPSNALRQPVHWVFNLGFGSLGEKSMENKSLRNKCSSPACSRLYIISLAQFVFGHGLGRANVS